MQTTDELRRQLESLEGGRYGDYKRVKGAWNAGDHTLSIDYVQGDPFARPTRVRVAVPAGVSALPDWTYRSADRRRATADFLNRRMHEELASRRGRTGSGRSGELVILPPAQQVLARTSLLVGEEGAVEARFGAGLPAKGRRILGSEAARLLCECIPDAVRASLLFAALDGDALRRHVEVVEDAVALRSQLEQEDLIAFVADGAVLPRRTGIDDRPLEGASVVPFRAPESLRVTLEAPNAGRLTGLGIRRGVTLVVGGGYHGKSTLLGAVERGVYDHVPGDGRERVVTVPHAVKVRAEDGRRVAGTDISNFIAGLPSGEDTAHFETENASGSTSQAAAIAEALEVGSRCLLLDEDTSATNFMIRDARMQALIEDEDEPITPFIDRARQLADQQGVSTLLVVGGSGDYFDVADTVVAMRAYVPRDLTTEARAVAERIPTRRAHEGGSWRPTRDRIPQPESIDPSRGRRDIDIRTRALDRVSFGRHEVDLAALEQTVERAQTVAMARALAFARDNALDGERTAAQGLSHLMRTIESDGLGAIDPEPVGDYAAFRVFEIAAFLNRLRTLRVTRAAQPPGESGDAM